MAIGDCQAGIGRISNFQVAPARGWIEERVSKAGGKSIAWVKGHSGVIGNQIPDLNAKRVVWEVCRRGDRNVAPAAGIRHEFRVTYIYSIPITVRSDVGFTRLEEQPPPCASAGKQCRMQLA